MKEIVGILTAVLSVVSLVPYLRDVLLKKTKPHLFSWIVWSISTVTAFFGQWFSGAGYGSWSTAITGIITIIITLLAFKFGTKDVTLSDKIYFFISCFAVFLWFLTKDPTISVILVTLVGMFAFFPTIRKSFNDSKSETLFTYVLNFIRHPFSIIALQNYTLTTVLFPVMLTIMNGITAFVIFKNRKAFKDK